MIQIVRKKYKRTRIENLEEILNDWLSFKGNDYNEEDDFLLAMESLSSGTSFQLQQCLVTCDIVGKSFSAD